MMDPIYFSSEWAAIVANIRANLDDDSCRLIAADWLDEHATSENFLAERAELIKLQIAATHHDPTKSTKAKTLFLRRRPKRLLKDHGAKWAIPLRDGFSDFARGFIESATCDGMYWQEKFHCMYLAHPLKHVTMYYWPALYAEVQGGYVFPTFEKQDLVISLPPKELMETCLAKAWPGVEFKLGDSFFHTIRGDTSRLESKDGRISVRVAPTDGSDIFPLPSLPARMSRA